MICVFKLVAPHGDIDYWASHDLAMSPLTRLRLTENAWASETYHRALKQCCGVQRAQRNHLGLALRPFLRREAFCYPRGLSWYQAKLDIIRHALRAYLSAPFFLLPPTA